MSILQYAFSWLHFVFCHTLLTRYKWHIQIFTVHSKCLGKFWWWWCYCDILWHSLIDSVPMLFPNSACLKNTFSFWSDKNLCAVLYYHVCVNRWKERNVSSLSQLRSGSSGFTLLRNTSPNWVKLLKNIEHKLICSSQSIIFKIWKRGDKQ